MRVIRGSIAIGLAMLGACAAPEQTLPSLRADLVLIGKVALVGELDVFYGDVAEAWKAYSLTNAISERRFEFVTSGQNCSIAPEAEQSYLVIVNRQRVSTAKGPSELYEASACIPLDSTMASSIQQYSPHRGARKETTGI